MVPLLIDANLLLLLLIGEIDRELVGRFKRTQKFTANDYDLLRQAMAPSGSLVSTPHILAETSNLIGQLSGDRMEQARARMAQFVVQADERSYPASAAIADASFARLGLTDATICCLANQAQLQVLTVDFDLWFHLSNQIGDRAVNFNHFRMR